MTYSSPSLDFKSVDLIPRPADSLIFLLDLMGPYLVWHFEILQGPGSEFLDREQ